MTIKNVSVKKMNPAPYNPREQLQPGDKDYESLKKSIKKYGFVQPIVWNERTGNIVGGHQRYYIALDLGYKSVSTKIVDLGESEEKQLNLGLNKIGGQWNEEKLSDLLNELKGFDGLDMDLTGFDTSEIDELTIAFNDIDIDLPDMPDLDEPEDMEEPAEDPFEDPGEDNNQAGPLQYIINYDDEHQKVVWNAFLRELKENYDNDAFPTHSSRIHAFLVKEVFNDGEE